MRKYIVLVSKDHYNLDWGREDCIKSIFRKNRRDIVRPYNFGEMKTIAEKLSADFEYVRVDFYENEGKLYFGEMTFTPAGNYMGSYLDDKLYDMLNFYKKTKL